MYRRPKSQPDERWAGDELKPPETAFIEEDETHKTVDQLLAQNPSFYPINQDTEAQSSIKSLRKTQKTVLKEPISWEVADVPQYHDPEIEKPWFKKVIKECQPHVHNYRMCLVDDINRDYMPEDIAREETCKILGWNLINCAARLFCQDELQHTGWDCYKNDPLNPTAPCEKSQTSLNSCLSLNKVMHVAEMIPAHITPDSWLWKDFDERWAWMKETGWGDWKQIYEQASFEEPKFEIREYFKRVELDRERRLVWLNRRREKYGQTPFTMEDLIDHEKDIDVYESMDRDVPKDFFTPTIYP